MTLQFHELECNFMSLVKFHELECNYMSLHAVQFHELVCSYISWNAVLLACMQLNEVPYFCLSSSQEFRRACYISISVVNCLSHINLC